MWIQSCPFSSQNSSETTVTVSSRWSLDLPTHRCSDIMTTFPVGYPPLLQPRLPPCCPWHIPSSGLFSLFSELRGILPSQVVACLSSPPKSLSVFKWHLPREAFPELFVLSHFPHGPWHPLVLYLIYALPGPSLTLNHAFIHSISVSSI